MLSFAATRLVTFLQLQSFVFEREGERDRDRQTG